MSATRYALVGIHPDTSEVQVVGLVNEVVLDTLRDMDGLVVVVTSPDHARQVFGEKVDPGEFVMDCVLGRTAGNYSGAFRTPSIEGSGTG
jgi:hypothetical protein